MSAQSINTFGFVLPNPEWGQQVGDKATANTSISFNLLLTANLQTLSPNVIAGDNNVEGLLYVPNLGSDDPCFNITQQYILPNVTRKVNLPDSQYSLIAHAPWVSPTCTESFLYSASADGARAFIFYQPGDSEDVPPAPNSVAWGLGDGGTWKMNFGYSVYAIPSFYGSQIMQQLALYSGNLMDAPNGSLLAEQYDSHDFIRLYTAINTVSSSSLPSLWVFLLIVMAMLLVVMGCGSCLMHGVQRRRRATLRRMIANGEVDLEALGVERPRVPQEVLDKLPLYTYLDEKHKPHAITLLASSQTDTIAATNPSPQSLKSPSLASSALSLTPSSSPATRPTQTNDQTICPICLEDFTSQQTTVRELPCGHIYHPECIDPFLKDYSTLCALCKGKVLPQGYCPTEVSNAMVRRERLIRRMRERITAEPEATDSHTGAAPSHPVTVQRRMTSFRRQFGFAGWRHHGERIAARRNGAGDAQELTTVAEGSALPQSGTVPRPTTPRPPGIDRAE